MKKSAGKLHMDGLLALLLLGVFAVCILAVLLTGAEAYQGLTDRGQTSYERRTAAQYLATRVRQADGAGQVAVGAFGASDALVLAEELAGERYLTRIYCHDGWLRELFTLDETGFAPEDGEKILPAEELQLTLQDDFLTASLIDGSGTEVQVNLTLRSNGEGAAP